MKHIRVAPPSGWALINLHELWAFRDLFWILMLRDVRLRYKQTLLGIIWVILQPLLGAIIFSVIFGHFAKLPSEGTPYELMVFTAMLPWNLFAGSLQRASNSLISDSRLISKVYFPRLAIPISSALAVLVDFLVSLVVLLVMLVLYRIPFSLNILALPFILVLTLILSIGVGLFLSALNVYYRDFGYALPFLIQIWLYASPVAYSTSIVTGRLETLYNLNPLVGVINGFRWACLGVGSFPWESLAFSAGAGVLVLVAGMLVFRRIEYSFADVI